ncbi:MAG: ATP-binding cassette domain-containing protein [Clostridia bacterium]|nr:ATP-binding cassette domain-containing protein [Clostridia bacterium]
MLELKNITKKFEENIAVDNISFKVEQGKIFGIVGRNGAGKSTTFRMILNIIEPTEGTCLYNGKKIDSNALDRIGYLPEEGSLIPTYTVVELCEYYGSLKLLSDEEIKINLIKWLEEFNILEYMNKKIKDLSKGNRQKIQFIISVLHNPDLIILDEPFSGLDPISVEELKKAILKLKEEGKTIIFSSHRMEHIEMLCEDVLLIDKGKSILQGNLKDILENYEIDGKKHNSLNEIFIDKVGSLDE